MSSFYLLFIQINLVCPPVTIQMCELVSVFVCVREREKVCVCVQSHKFCVGACGTQRTFLNVIPRLQYIFYFIVLFCLGLCVLFWFCFGDRVSLCIPGQPGTHYSDQAGLEFI